ncbi:hypothetical protein LX15_006079 [Streptoalloteichus tenebrarius]|uniref:Uncharacterized protein n=1 Tax=Streptoalloteichus tenebrarius (strain ATCC 17920 / DSM 40477 / JCM 4838 / CBS 697.72 / NBRC 16177 / NCIMB 11028 / NRRL B-12390 / A12253. 1 / ISP 5477) TaxID=1933 RepID=A0ABT1I3N5_STRSD|nr:hypothetical protein [Streptoalloteichus tenebrarius]MCP2262343.1 hypothetical protein [Streptoalloteichus tenebrarius]BFF02054.1 hypothetical protein GCM10020241_37290 [Streptoalloteichus tenebrarius]
MLAFVGEAVVRVGALPAAVVLLGLVTSRLARALRDPYRVWRCRRTTARIRRECPVAPVVLPRQRRETPAPGIEVRPRQPVPAPARAANRP